MNGTMDGKGRLLSWRASAPNDGVFKGILGPFLLGEFLFHILHVFLRNFVIFQFFLIFFEISAI